MLPFLFVSTVLAAAASPATAPASEEAAAGAAIRANFERLGSYEVEFVRTDEGFQRLEETPDGGFILISLSEPFVSTDLDTDCTWKDDARSMAYHYRGLRPNGDGRELKFDGVAFFGRSWMACMAGIWDDRAWTKEVMDRISNDRIEVGRGRSLKRLNADMLTPMDLMFFEDGEPPTFFSPAFKKIVRGRYGFDSKERVTRSADGWVDARGIKTVQVDREAGLWKPVSPEKPDQRTFQRVKLTDRWWLDPSHNYLPVKAELYFEEGLLTSRTEVLEFQLMAPNTWFPVLGTITNFDVAGKFASHEDKYKRRFENRVPARKTTIQVTKISIGQTFTPDEFKPGPDEKVREAPKR